MVIELAYFRLNTNTFFLSRKFTAFMSPMGSMTLGRIKILVSSTSFLLQGMKLKITEPVT